MQILLFSLIYTQVRVPDQWLVSKTIPAYKNKGDKKDVEVLLSSILLLFFLVKIQDLSWSTTEYIACSISRVKME